MKGVSVVWPPANVRRAPRHMNGTTLPFEGRAGAENPDQGSTQLHNTQSAPTSGWHDRTCTRREADSYNLEGTRSRGAPHWRPTTMGATEHKGMRTRKQCSLATGSHEMMALHRVR